jgi:hypothetical protein
VDQRTCKRGINVKCRSSRKKERTALAQRRQPPPEGAHAPPPVLADGPEVAKVENCCAVFLEPHLGQTGAGWFLLSTSFSKVFLQFSQVYSKIGIGNTHLQFLLLSGLSSRPDRAEGRGDQVKRDAPGILGRMRIHTTMKMIKTITPSIPTIIHHRGLRAMCRKGPPILDHDVRKHDCRAKDPRQDLP